VWRLIVSPLAGSTRLGVLAIASSMVFLGLQRITRRTKGSFSPEPKRFEKCCGHRPVAGLLPAVLFHIRETAHRAVATAAAVLCNSIQTQSSLSSFPSFQDPSGNPRSSKFQSFRRKGSKNFTQYFCERPEMTSPDEKSKKAKTRKNLNRKKQ
jgi:hypothetical protein